MSPAVEHDGRFLEIPLDSYPRIEQGGAILSWASNADAARLFRSFLMRDDARGGWCREDLVTLFIDLHRARELEQARVAV